MRGSRIGIIVAAFAPLVAAADPCLLVNPTFARNACDFRACLACHDGGAGPAIHCEHPVGVSYAPSWLSRRGSLRPDVPPELPFTAGQVTCATCHDGASSAPHRLVVVRGPTGLCGGCHAK